MIKRTIAATCMVAIFLCTTFFAFANESSVNNESNGGKLQQNIYKRDGDIVVEDFPNKTDLSDHEYYYRSDNMQITIDVIRDNQSMQTLYVADVWIKNIHSFRTCFAHDKFIYDMETTSNALKEDGPTMAKRNNAILGVNGCYNVGLTVHSGIVYGLKDTESSGAIVLYRDGFMRTFNTAEEDFNVEKELEKGMYHAWQFGPVLIHEGQKTERGVGMTTRHPRTVIGYYKPGHYVFVTCDGRSDIARGMTFDEMREFMHSLGVQEALNMDGGYSSVMTYMGEMINKNTYWGYDSNEKKLQGRPIPDFIYFVDCNSKGEIITLPQLKERTDAKELISKITDSIIG